MNQYKDELVVDKSLYSLEKNWDRPEYPWVRLSDNTKGYMVIRKDGVYFVPVIKDDSAK